MLYGLAVRSRNLAFDIGWKKTHHANVPVISLGNLTTGGTGKTPFAAFIARWFRVRGIRVCFLSRGYGAVPGAANDEALVLELLCPDVPHLQNADRVQSAQIACEELESQLLILDDGFQHRRLARDLDIVLIDALHPWGHGYLLPRGLLREPLSGLRRADLVVVTRVDQASAEQVQAICQRVAAIRLNSDIVCVAFPAVRLVNAAGVTEPLQSLIGKSIGAFCGIGNPQAFEASLVQAGMHVASFRSFADHHPYSRQDIDDLRQWSAAAGAAAIVTTQKDLVKIGLETLGDRPLWAIEIGTQIISGANLLETKLAELAGRLLNSPSV